MNLPPLESEDLSQDLGWHALNYRTAHPLHAQELFEELERFVRAFGESCARMAREEERQQWVVVVTEMLRAMGLPNVEALAAAIRKG